MTAKGVESEGKTSANRTLLPEVRRTHPRRRQTSARELSPQNVA